MTWTGPDLHSNTYSLVVGVNKDDLVVLVDTVLVDPVRVENTEVPAPPADTLLRNAPQATLGLEVVDTLTDGLAVGGTWFVVEDFGDFLHTTD